MDLHGFAPDHHELRPAFYVPGATRLPRHADHQRQRHPAHESPAGVPRGAAAAQHDGRTGANAPATADAATAGSTVDVAATDDLQEQEEKVVPSSLQGSPTGRGRRLRTVHGDERLKAGHLRGAGPVPVLQVLHRQEGSDAKVS